MAYISHIPPALRPNKLRGMLGAHAEIGRIYLAPRDKPGAEAGAAGPASKKKKAAAAAAGSKQVRGRHYHEGWVEFMSKKACKRVCALLHGTPMHGKRRSKHNYDLWCIQYVSKLKWDMINGIGVHMFGHSHPEMVRAQLEAGLSDVCMEGNLQFNADMVA